jgi:hypothetical protein
MGLWAVLGAWQDARGIGLAFVVVGTALSGGCLVAIAGRPVAFTLDANALTVTRANRGPLTICVGAVRRIFLREWGNGPSWARVESDAGKVWVPATTDGWGGLIRELAARCPQARLDIPPSLGGRLKHEAEELAAPREAAATLTYRGIDLWGPPLLPAVLLGLWVGYVSLSTGMMFGPGWALPAIPAGIALHRLCQYRRRWRHFRLVADGEGLRAAVGEETLLAAPWEDVCLVESTGRGVVLATAAHTLVLPGPLRGLKGVRARMKGVGR